MSTEVFCGKCRGGPAEGSYYECYSPILLVAVIEPIEVSIKNINYSEATAKISPVHLYEFVNNSRNSGFWRFVRTENL